jgi:hypothetical protein
MLSLFSPTLTELDVAVGQVIEDKFPITDAYSWMWWCTSVIPSTLEGEAGRLPGLQRKSLI